LVVTNNQSWADVSKLIATRAIEGVIISPGPGRPDCPADFGVCSELLLHCNLPIFGVCLGHQGIAHFHGARVVVAKEPRHGRLSQVTVLAEDVRASTDQEVGEEQLSLFSGVASPFTVVRYHSLVVDRQSLPETLLPLAETEDGALMGLRHTKLPHWGVQFHPVRSNTRSHPAPFAQCRCLWLSNFELPAGIHMLRVRRCASAELHRHSQSVLPAASVGWARRSGTAACGRGVCLRYPAGGCPAATARQRRRGG
jgi:anthranilate/para-aminobenzoate synthase component II